MGNATRVALAAIAALAVVNLATIASHWPAPRFRQQHQTPANDDRGKQGASADTQQEIPPSDQDSGQKGEGKGGSETHSIPRDALTLAGVLALLGAFVSVGGLLRTWAVQRPWVLLSVSKDNVLRALKSRIPPPGGVLRVTCEVTNYSGVPGWLKSGYAELLVLNHPLEKAEPRSICAVRRRMRKRRCTHFHQARVRTGLKRPIPLPAMSGTGFSPAQPPSYSSHRSGIAASAFLGAYTRRDSPGNGR